MRRVFGLLTASCLVAWGCDGPRYELNEKVLSAISVEDAFKALQSGHVLHRKGGSQGGGSSNDVYERDEIFTITGVSFLPEDFSEKLAHSIADQISRAGGAIRREHGTGEIWYAKEAGRTAPDAARPDTLGAKVFFSIAGSKGALNLRYTAVKAEDAIGYLSCEIVEFRR